MLNDDIMKRIFVWQKGIIVKGYDPAKYRKDRYDTLIEWNEYGNRNSRFGWEIDHIIPDSSDEIENLQPLNWRNNIKKSDTVPRIMSGVVQLFIKKSNKSNQRRSIRSQLGL